MFNSQSYVKWQRHLAQLIPDTCQSRITNLALLIVGIMASSSIHLSVIACKVPIRAKKLSIAKRFERFLSNEAIDVEAWYRGWAEWLLQAASVSGDVHLIVDTTKVSARHRLLMIGVAYHRRTLPIIWDWIEYPRGHCTAAFQVRLLERLKPYIPEGIEVTLAGDSEFGSVEMIRALSAWKWTYVLRQKGSTRVRIHGSTCWQRLDSFDISVGECFWFGNIRLTQATALPTHLVLYWKKGEKEPWLLATNCLSGFPAVRLYKRRMWIEEMFGDMKGHGFDLERTRLRTPERLSRLTLAVSILYVWLVTAGEYVICNQFASEVDRTDRRDLSIFRIGWDWLERRFTFDDPIPILFRPNLCLVSGC